MVVIESFYSSLIVPKLTDDAYYYLVVARRYIESYVLTFDGLVETTGLHPLMLLFQIVLFTLWSPDGPLESYQLLVFALHIVFCVFLLTVVILSYTRSKKRFIGYSAVIFSITMLFVLQRQSTYLNGMESLFVLPLMLLAFYWSISRDYIKTGIALSFLVLARLDSTLYLVPAFAISAFYDISIKNRTRFSWSDAHTVAKTQLQTIGPALLITALVVAYLFVNYGEYNTTSGVLKSSFPSPNIQPHLLFAGDLGWFRLLVNILMVLSPFGLLVVYKFVGRNNISFSIGLRAVIILLSYSMGILLFQKWSKPVPPWYYAPIYVALSLFIWSLFTVLFSQRAIFNILSIAVLFIIVVGIIKIGSHVRANAMKFDVADVVRDPVVSMAASEPHATFAKTDCGYLSFWSNADVINLDGLVNSYDYQSVLNNNMFGHYVRMNVDYLIVDIWDRQQNYEREYEAMYRSRVSQGVFSGDYDKYPFFVYSYRYMKYSDTVWLHRDQEVLRTEPEKDGLVNVRTVVYALDNVLYEPVLNETE